MVEAMKTVCFKLKCVFGQPRAEETFFFSKTVYQLSLTTGLIRRLLVQACRFTGRGKVLRKDFN